jgi:hypothetical protein
LGKAKRGMRRGLAVYGDEEFSLFLRKAFIKVVASGANDFGEQRLAAARYQGHVSADRDKVVAHLHQVPGLGGDEVQNSRRLCR